MSVDDQPSNHLKNGNTQKDQQPPLPLAPRRCHHIGSNNAAADREQNNEQIAELRTFSMSRPALRRCLAITAQKSSGFLHNNCVVNEIFMPESSKQQQTKMERNKEIEGSALPRCREQCHTAEETNKYLKLRWCTISSRHIRCLFV